MEVVATVLARAGAGTRHLESWGCFRDLGAQGVYIYIYICIYVYIYIYI